MLGCAGGPSVNFGGGGADIGGICAGERLGVGAGLILGL